MSASTRSVKVSSLSSVWELRPFVSILLSSLRPAAIQREIILANDIPDDICIDADREMLASVLGGLLTNVIGHAIKSCIQVTAKVYTDVILLHIKDHNSVHCVIIDNMLGSMAEKMGGFVTVSSQRKNLSTIAFSFPNLPVGSD